MTQRAEVTVNIHYRVDGKGPSYHMSVPIALVQVGREAELDEYVMAYDARLQEANHRSRKVGNGEGGFYG